MTICIDVSETNMSLVQQLVDELETKLNDDFGDQADPHYNFDTVIEKVKE